MMDCVLSGSLLVVFSLFCYAMCVFFEQINSLSLSLSLSQRLSPLLHITTLTTASRLIITRAVRHLATATLGRIGGDAFRAV